MCTQYWDNTLQLKICHYTCIANKILRKLTMGQPLIRLHFLYFDEVIHGDELEGSNWSGSLRGLSFWTSTPLSNSEKHERPSSVREVCVHPPEDESGLTGQPEELDQRVVVVPAVLLVPVVHERVVQDDQLAALATRPREKRHQHAGRAHHVPGSWGQNVWIVLTKCWPDF